MGPNGDRADVKKKLYTSLPFQDATLLLMRIAIMWVIAVVNSLLQYISHFLGILREDLENLSEHVVQFKGMPQDLAHFNECLVLLEDDVPRALEPNAASPSVKHQEQCLSRSQTRCKQCHALGHDTSACHSKDPVVVKKWVLNNQKA